MNKKQMIIALTLAVGMVLAGCGGGNGAQEPGNAANNQTASNNQAATQNQTPDQSNAVSVAHEWGTMTLEQAPQNVVSLDFSFIDTLTSLGIAPAGNAGVGTTKIPEYLEDMIAAQVTDVGERKAPNLEVIQSLKPDLIIASVDRHSMIRAELEGIANTVAFDDVSYDQVLDNVRSIGELMNKQEEAEQVIAGLNEKISAVRQQIDGSPTLLVAGLFDDEFTVWVKESFIGSLLSEVGVDYAFDSEVMNLEGKGEGAKITLERLHEINPDYIMLYGDKADKLHANPLYQDLKAVKDNHFIEVDRNLWSRGRGPIAAGNILDETLALLSADSASE